MNDVTEEPITIVRETTLEFLNELNKEKSQVENFLRARIEETKTNYLSQIQGNITMQNLDEVVSLIKQEVIDTYRNRFYMGLVTLAVHEIRNAIYKAISEAGIIKKEVLEELKELRQQQKPDYETEHKVQQYESELISQTEKFSELSSENNQLKLRIQELEQLIREKDAEISNLSGDIERLEAQINNLGSTMLMNIEEKEEMQQLIAQRDAELSKAKAEKAALMKQLQEYQATINSLQEKLDDARSKEREYVSKQLNANDELFENLKQELEKAKDDLYKKETELVKKNEEIRKLSLEIESLTSRLTTTKEQIESKEQQIKDLETKYKNLQAEYDALQQKHQDLALMNEKYERERASLESKYKEELDTISKEKDQLMQELEQAKLELESLREELSQYEGKVSISSEDRLKLEQEIVMYREKVKDLEKFARYYKVLAKSDPQTQILSLLTLSEGKLRDEDLAKALGLNTRTVRKILLEMGSYNLIKLEKEGSRLFAAPLNEIIEGIPPSPTEEAAT